MAICLSDNLWAQDSCKQYHIQKMDSLTDCYFNYVNPSEVNKQETELLRIKESRDIYYTDRDFKRKKKLITKNIN